MSYKQYIYIIPETDKPKSNINFSPNIKSKKLFYKFKHFHNLHLWLNLLYNNYLKNETKEFNRSKNTVLLSKQDIELLKNDIKSNKFIKYTKINNLYIDYNSDSEYSTNYNLTILLQFCKDALKPEHEHNLFYYVSSNNVKYFY